MQQVLQSTKDNIMNEPKMTYEQMMKLDIVNYDDLDTVVTNIFGIANRWKIFLIRNSLEYTFSFIKIFR